MDLDQQFGSLKYLVGFLKKIVKINTMIKSSVEINRKPDDVFALHSSIDKHGEWQEAIISSKKNLKAPLELVRAILNSEKCQVAPRGLRRR